jgi:hypothetical protein
MPEESAPAGVFHDDDPLVLDPSVLLRDSP